MPLFEPEDTTFGDFLGGPLLGGLHALGITSAATEPTDPIGKAEFEGIFGSGSWDDPVVHADLAMALHGTPTAYGKVTGTPTTGKLGAYMGTRHYDPFAVGTEGADPSGTTPSTSTKKDEGSKSSTVVLSPSGSRSSVPTGTAGYPYLIPPAFDFSGPANMPYTRNYWETHGLPMGLLEYVYPGPGSGYTDFTGGDPFATGGLLGGRSSGLLGDVPRILPGGSVTASSTKGVITAEEVAEKKDTEKKDAEKKDDTPKSDFEEHYPDDRGHDVGKTSPIYDDAPPTFVPTPIPTYEDKIVRDARAPVPVDTTYEDKIVRDARKKEAAEAATHGSDLSAPDIRPTITYVEERYPGSGGHIVTRPVTKEELAMKDDWMIGGRGDEPDYYGMGDTSSGGHPGMGDASSYGSDMFGGGF